ncbi:MAG: Uncharacterised protein [Cellulomonadaceae bacterium TMED98]|nr:MAG: Uncharacterised protein [Cellulomonadaceae bacterium TMED98]
MSASFSKPVRMSSAHLELIDAPDDMLWERHPERALELAHDTAQMVVDHNLSKEAGKTVDRLKEFVDAEGIETLAELWAPAEPSSLPGALWRLFVMRQHLSSRPDVLADLVERGLAQLSTIDPVIVGAQEPVSADGVLEIVNQILEGTFSGNLSSALERAAALARVVSAGLLDWPITDTSDSDTALSALHWEELSRALSESARREKSGQLR